ncbi:aldehyde ferredoxin oxidoreductase [Shewanella dokdonensis]|uniref:Aldehyde ferredoxin oxidoreductase n=1 Tax=Shewanella dokdonensis TaxID=712036 RepID=A0ABX8DFA4_9GAMM|nr:aldehyde ferredoxin oxidoreductase [Shewanella dokdonensis]MCL1074983.1 aldehyde ferredoxin oxidoreductase [Shewanella dokdonensis]QVK23414.1 aldehyde ferredoxin oxidoreductase [Shewanella dokdonensis]
MAMNYGGWAGKVLWVNLTTSEIWTEPTEKYLDYLGGSGIGYKILWDHHVDGQLGTDPENVIVYSIGPLTGSGVICSGRMTVTSRSPATPGHLITDGHVGGHIGPEFKYAGYDALAVVGKANSPVWIRIEDDKVSIESATAIWGKGTFDSNAELNKLMGQDAQVFSIGQAGENLVPMSGFMTPGGHAAGGHGAVMGSKNLKGVGVRGTGTCRIKASRDDMRALDDHILGIIGSNNNNVVPSTPQSWAEYSSSGSRWKARDAIKWGAADEPVELGEVAWNERNRIGYRCSMAEMYVGVEYTNKWLKRMGGCHACPIRCYCEMKVPELKSRFKFKSEYITNTCGGFIWGNYLMPTTSGTEQFALTATAGAYLRDDYGIFSGYGLTHHMFKVMKKADIFKDLLTPEEFADVPWELWDNNEPEFLVDLYKRVAFPDSYSHPNGLGRMMGDPVSYIDIWKLDGTNDAIGNWNIYAEHDVHLFNRSMRHALHHASECASQVGTLINVIFNRDPMCHSHINVVNGGLPHDILAEVCAEKFGEGAFDPVKWYTPINQGKVNFAKWCVVKNVLHDSLTICNWVFPLIISPDKDKNYRGDSTIEAQMYSLVTGNKVSEEELDIMAERTVQLHRAFTALEMNSTNLRLDHDVLSDWVYDVDADKNFGDQGTIKMDRDDIQKALGMFYESWGWDSETGIPTRATLEKFGLGYAADKLEAKGLLPE